jgi:hypothetical protein
MPALCRDGFEKGRDAGDGSGLGVAQAVSARTGAHYVSHGQEMGKET